MIGPTGAVRVMVATKPVDFRKGAEGLAALVCETMQADPFDGAVYVFRAKRADRIKLVFEPWLREKLALISQKTKLAEAIRYALSRWDGLTRFIDDGRIEIDSNVVERAIRPIALNRKNALFAGSDGGGENWAIVASLVETCKLNGVDPQTYMADVLTKIANGHLANKLDELMPWAYAPPTALKDVA